MTPTDTEDSARSQTIAAQVLWCFDAEGGIRPGSFFEALYAVISKADPVNRRKLAYGFPEEVAAVGIAQDHPLGLALLARIARGEIQ